MVQSVQSSKRNYAQVDKEALSLVFGVKQSHNYLYGRNFTLVMDHKPLTTHPGPKEVYTTAGCGSITEVGNHLVCIHVPDRVICGGQANTDGLSRLPLSDDTTTEGRSSVPQDFNVSQIESIPVTSSQLRLATYRDILLSKALKYTKRGWPTEVKEPLRRFWNRRDELTIKGDCLLWGG